MRFPYPHPAGASRWRSALLLGAFFCCMALPGFAQITIESTPALGAPPDMLGEFKVVPVPAMDDWTAETRTTSIPLQNVNENVITSSRTLYVLKGTRSMFPVELTGDFFNVSDETTVSVTLALPERVRALYFYAASGSASGAQVTVSVAVNNGEEELKDITIPTSQRSRLFTIQTQGSSVISTVTITSDQSGVQFGGFGIAIEE